MHIVTKINAVQTALASLSVPDPLQDRWNNTEVLNRLSQVSVPVQTPISDACLWRWSCTMWLQKTGANWWPVVPQHCNFCDGSNYCNHCAISCFHTLPGSLSNRDCSSTVGECLCPHCYNCCSRRGCPIGNRQAPGLQPRFLAVKPLLHCQVQSLNRLSVVWREI